MSRAAIINADDFGFTPAITEGIVEAFRRGVVTSTTAMVNMPGAADRIARTRAQNPDLPVGLHLNITAGRPVLPPERVPSLVKADGCFYSMIEQIERLDQISVDEVRAELTAQAALLAETSGPFDHIDYHQMLLSLYAPFYPAVIELARAYRVPVRQPAINRFYPVKVPQPGGADRAAVKELLRLMLRKPFYFLKYSPQMSPVAANRQGKRLAQVGIPTTDWFITAFFNNASVDNILAILAQLPSGVSEIMCHPGRVDEALLASGDEYTTMRETELAVLTDPRVVREVQEQGIRLVSFGALSAAVR